jgi:hypothetical protein
MEAKRLAETVAMHEAPAAPSLLDEVLDVTAARYAEGKLPKRARRRAEPKPPPEPVRFAVPSFMPPVVRQAYDAELRRVRAATLPGLYVDEPAFFENRRPDSFDTYVAAPVPAEPPTRAYDRAEVEWLNREPTRSDELRAERARVRSGEDDPNPAGAKLVGFTHYSGLPLYKLGRWVICGTCFRQECAFSQLVED